MASQIMQDQSRVAPVSRALIFSEPSPNHSTSSFSKRISSSNNSVSSLSINKPLSTITNNNNEETISTSPKFQTVTEAQKRIAKLQKRTATKKQGQPLPVPTRKHVQEMRKQVKEKINTPAKAPRSSQWSTINIPMNKVNELKKKLNESKMQELKKLESAQMNAKKRAEIKERVNTVQGLLKGLNGNGNVLGNGNGNGNGNMTTSLNKATPRMQELNLPRARVSEMKNWLKEFENENKAHANKWNTPGRGAGAGGAYIPRTGERNGSLSLGNNASSSAGNNFELDGSEGRKVSELSSWLTGFGEGNKAHYEKGLFAKSGPGTGGVFPGSGSVNGYPQQEGAEQVEEEAFDQDDIADRPVENISMLEEGDGDKKDLNISMMPAVPFHDHGGGKDEDEDDDDDDDDNKNINGHANESDWEDDYQDLMMTVDIEQVESADSWDKESVVSPKEFIEGETNSVDKPKPAQDNSELYQEEVEDKIDQSSDTGSAEEQNIENIIEDDDEESAYIAEETMNDEDSVASDDRSFDDEEEGNVMTFECDDISKMSFEGQPTGFVTAADFAPRTIQEVSSAEIDDTTSLDGEHILTSDPIVSTSVFGTRLSDSMAVPGHARSKSIVQKKKKTGFRKFMSSLNCLKQTKASKAAEMFANTAEETKRPNHNRERQHKPSSRSLFLSPDSQQDDNDNPNTYLPKNYNHNGMNAKIPGDFAREMMLTRGNKGYNPNSESPVSLASAYRRQLSPDSSCVSGFTDVEGCDIIKKHDIGQHVKHLQEIFDSPLQEETLARKEDVKLLHMF